MRLFYGRNFVKSANNLPKNAQEKLAELLIIFRVNPFDSRLHTKYLTGELTGLLSFRITRDLRVIFQFNNPGAIQLLRVKYRKDVYR